MCLTVTPKVPADLDLRNPNFQLGRVQAAMSILVLLFCFIGKYTYCRKISMIETLHSMRAIEEIQNMCTL